MSPSGEVSMRLVKPLPGPLVMVTTMLAPKIRSVAFVVVAVPLLLVLLLPLPEGHIHRIIRVCAAVLEDPNVGGDAAALEKVTVTALAPAPAATMFLA